MLRVTFLLCLATYLCGLAGCGDDADNAAARSEAACQAMGGYVVDTLEECCCDCLDSRSLEDGRWCCIDYWPDCPVGSLGVPDANADAEAGLPPEDGGPDAEPPTDGSPDAEPPTDSGPDGG